MACDTVETRKT